MFRAIFCFVFVFEVIFAIPSQIIIIRHGEKHPNCTKLSSKGRERALALSIFFLVDPFVTKVGLPKAILSYQPEAPNFSQRGPETVGPLSEVLGIEIEKKYKGEEFALLAKDVLQNPKYDNIPVLICWMHGKIPELLENLGFSDIPKYPEDEFDLIFRISYEKNQKPKLCIGMQRLLFGDLPTLPSAFSSWDCY